MAALVFLKLLPGCLWRRRSRLVLDGSRPDLDVLPCAHRSAISRAVCLSALDDLAAMEELAGFRGAVRKMLRLAARQDSTRRKGVGGQGRAAGAA